MLLIALVLTHHAAHTSPLPLRQTENFAQHNDTYFSRIRWQAIAGSLQMAKSQNQMHYAKKQAAHLRRFHPLPANILRQDFEMILILNKNRRTGGTFQLRLSNDRPTRLQKHD